MRGKRPFAPSGRFPGRLAGPLLATAALALAGFLLHRQLSRYSLEDIRGALAAIGPRELLLVGLFTACSYICLTLSEAVSARYAGRRLAYPKTAFASFVSLSLGHNIGFAALSSGAVRYRIYSLWSLGLGDVARIIVLCGVTVALGHATLAAAALVLQPGLAAETLGVARWMTLPGGLALAAAVGGYLFFVWRADCASIRLWRWRLATPPLRLAALQVPIGAANSAFVAAALYGALPGSAETGYLAVATVYVLASVAAITSHVPGGLGVLEAVVLAFSPELSTVGALVAFRVVYYLIPLGVGALLFAAFEIARRRRHPEGAGFAIPQPRGGER